jgi:hypothetical protein
VSQVISQVSRLTSNTPILDVSSASLCLCDRSLKLALPTVDFLRVRLANIVEIAGDEDRQDDQQPGEQDDRPYLPGILRGGRPPVLRGWPPICQLPLGRETWDVTGSSAKMPGSPKKTRPLSPVASWPRMAILQRQVGSSGRWPA